MNMSISIHFSLTMCWHIVVMSHKNIRIRICAHILATQFCYFWVSFRLARGAFRLGHADKTHQIHEWMLFLLCSVTGFVWSIKLAKNGEERNALLLIGAEKLYMYSYIGDAKFDERLFSLFGSPNKEYYRCRTYCLPCTYDWISRQNSGTKYTFRMIVPAYNMYVYIHIVWKSCHWVEQ